MIVAFEAYYTVSLVCWSREWCCRVKIHYSNLKCSQQDDAGNFSETQVIINIINQLTPEFEYNPYETSVPENQVSLPSIALPLPQSTNSVTSDVLNYTSLFWLPLYILDLLFYQVGPFLEVLPASIQANASEESNYTIIYSISEGMKIHFHTDHFLK